MTVTEGPLPGLLIIQPSVMNDERGYFFESFHAARFGAAGMPDPFVQDNQSMSFRHVLRGLHFQNPPHAQGKLVRVVHGSALDVVVDIRPASPAYGRHFKIVLDDRTHTMLWVPPGFAHGFLALEDRTVFHYKCTAYYDRASESGIRWDDPALGIDWETAGPVVSAKDKLLKSFDAFENRF